MEVYTPGKVKCEKCGVEMEPTSVYRTEREGISSSTWQARPEAIIRKCTNCGYDWLEAPIDA